jgi:DNA-binding response OmpR family regulator
MAKILVIDDDPAIRRMVNRVLTAAGHQVIEATDGRDGFRKFQAEAPRIVITDIVMPEQEGMETIRSIRRAGSEVGIIAISGGGSGRASVYLDWAEALGADAILAKPFRPAELQDTVDRLLAGPSGDAAAG